MDKDTVEVHIGILTFHMANNFGAMLQAYALQKTLLEMGTHCEILDYRLEYINKWSAVYTWKEHIADVGFFHGSGRFLWRHINGWYHRIPLSRKKFNSFMHNELALSPKMYLRREQLVGVKYDAIVYGSDQIWNPECTGGYAPEYLGACINDKDISLISYAASCGEGHLPPKYEQDIISRLHLFSDLSVREPSLACFLHDSFEIDAQFVLDPVMLVDISIWEQLAIKSDFYIDKPYLLLYCFDAEKDIYDVALKIAKERGLKPVAICYKDNPYLYGFEKIDTCGPIDFVYLIMHASFICTTSFHGLAFSIIFEKSFYCMAHPKYGQRERDLIDLTGLQNRLIRHYEELAEIEDCDYTNVRNIISQYRKQSTLFLETAINRVKKKKLDSLLP